MADAKNGAKGNAGGQKRRSNSPRYSEKYGAGHVNPYTGYKQPGSAPAGQIYHPESIDLSKRSKLIEESAAGLVGASPVQRSEMPVAPDAPAPAKEESVPAQESARDSGLEEHLEEIRSKAAAEMKAEIATQAAQNAAAPIPDGTAQLRLSADGKPMVAVPMIDEQGNSQIKWIPLSIPGADDNAAAVIGAAIPTAAKEKPADDGKNADDEKPADDEKDTPAVAAAVIPAAMVEDIIPEPEEDADEPEAEGSEEPEITDDGSDAADEPETDEDGSEDEDGDHGAESGADISEEDKAEEWSDDTSGGCAHEETEAKAEDNSAECEPEESESEDTAAVCGSEGSDGEYADDGCGDDEAEAVEPENEPDAEDNGSDEQDEEENEYLTDSDFGGEEFFFSSVIDTSAIPPESDDDDGSDEPEAEESDEYEEPDDESDDEESEDESDDEDSDNEESEDDDDMTIFSREDEDDETQALIPASVELRLDESEDDEYVREYERKTARQDDELFKRRERPESSTAVFNLPDGVRLPDSIDDEDFLERWLNEGDDMASNDKRRKRRISTIIGAATMIFALIGFIWVLKYTFGAISGLSSTDSRKEEYAGFISPVVMSEVDAFETWNTIPGDKLLQSSIFYVMTHIEEGRYNTDDTNKLVVPSADVVAAAKILFGDDVTLDVNSYAAISSDDVYYSDIDDCFHVAATGISGPEAVVTNIVRNGNNMTLTVEYKEQTDTAAESSSYKTMVFILTSDDDGYYISAIRTADAESK